MSTRFPGVAKRNFSLAPPRPAAVGPNSEPPPSSQAKPGIHASPSTYPLALDSSASEATQGNSLPQMVQEVEAFVARLQPPPGVVHHPRAQQLPSTPSVQTDSTTSEPAAGSGDTTVIVRRAIFPNDKTKQFLLIGSATLAAVFFLGIVGTIVIIRSNKRSDESHESPSKSVTSTTKKEQRKPRPKPRRNTPSRPVKDLGSAAVTPRSAPPPTATERKATDTTIPPAPELIPGQGAVYVASNPEGTVYVAGVAKVETGHWLVLQCNRSHFLRVGKPVAPRFGGGTKWLAKGKSVYVRCGETKHVTQWHTR